MAMRISDDWQERYGHPIYLLETFVDPERFRGTCYRAAKLDHTWQDNGSRKLKQSPVSHPRSSNRTCGLPASGFPTGFTSKLSTEGQCGYGEAAETPGSP
jgi:hypothetical protein